eukprot:6955900-Karenia_brevis.AAC.1
MALLVWSVIPETIALQLEETVTATLFVWDSPPRVQWRRLFKRTHLRHCRRRNLLRNLSAKQERFWQRHDSVLWGSSQ